MDPANRACMPEIAFWIGWQTPKYKPSPNQDFRLQILPIRLNLIRALQKEW